MPSRRADWRFDKLNKIMDEQDKKREMIVAVLNLGDHYTAKRLMQEYEGQYGYFKNIKSSQL